VLCFVVLFIPVRDPPAPFHFVAELYRSIVKFSDSTTGRLFEMPRKRILFLAEGSTMAHFVRPFVLADSLDTGQYDIFFYTPRGFSPYLRHKPFIAGELKTMGGEQFLANIGKGSPAFPADVIREYVKCDCELIRSIGPDLVIGDMRPSLQISARLEGVCCAVIINAYWSPYAKRRSIIPSIPLTRIVPPRFLGPLYRMTEPLAFAVHVGPTNRVRKEFGIPPLPPDLRLMYTEADHVLYPDVPEFVPTSNLPKNHHYVGICQWNPPVPEPDWWRRMRDDPKPKALIALGSSGALRALPAIVGALSRLSVSGVLATSGRGIPATAAGMYVGDLLPLTETAARCDIAVSHGGSTGVYPSLAAGTPVLGIPCNADQQLSAAILVESGAGLGVRVEEASEKRLMVAIERLLYEPQYRVAAKRWAAVFEGYDSGVLFRRFVYETLSKSPGPGAVPK
jgi:UDP:flavonoid glycosyltransferase YjiC (YdhE family)